MNDLVKNIILWVVIALTLAMLFGKFGAGNEDQNTIAYSQFLSDVKNQQIESATFEGLKISGKRRNEGGDYTTFNPESDNTLLITLLTDNNVKVAREKPEGESILLALLFNAFPIILLIGVYIYFMKQMQGGGKGGAMSFGKSKAKLMTEDQVKVTFADVAGVEEAKEEVGEIVEFLRDPSKFQRLGGMIPRGILMVGQPGTGKTLLAKAIAGEARVPFFSISGSDFVEMFVGVGASRVRDMFEQAKKHSPCIIFIDEIDAVGRHRGGGHGGGNDEREQTLNQLLVEMDGFEGNEGVIVIAATNRSDVLDKALLRPGRFDRQVVVPLPDIRGREQILKVHMKKVPLDGDVDARVLARGTPGFSGAELANLVNEAALFSARANKRKVGAEEFEKARDKIMMGAERKSMVMSEAEKEMTAYHEAGHAIVGYLMPEHDPVHKVTIIPRGQALGVTHYLPEDDRLSYSKRYMLGRIASAYGGRIAEEITGGADSVSNGAASDIQQATSIARSMVVNYGMSDELGPLDFDARDNDALGSRHVSSHTEKLIDSEIRRITSECYDLATKTLEDNRDILESMKDALMDYETIDSKQVEDLMERRKVREPAGWEDDNGDSSASSGGDKTTGEGSEEKDPEAKDSDDKPIGGPAELH